MTDAELPPCGPRVSSPLLFPLSAITAAAPIPIPNSSEKNAVRRSRRNRGVGDNPAALGPSGISPARISNANSLCGQKFGWSPQILRPFKGIVCGDISEIAVGTLITERPPHRTVRAQFGHTAPTLGV